MKSSFFVPKSRKTYGCEMPALRAIVSVEAPWSPRAANSTSAASSTASRRSSAVLRVRQTGFTASKLSDLLTNVSSGFGDAIELRLGHRRRNGSASARSNARSAPGNGPWSR